MPVSSVEIDQILLDKLAQRAAARGVSLRAYLEGILELELAKSAGTEEDEAITRKLQQFGYIDAGLDI